ncbi:MAG: glycosyl hydrolase family 2 [Candidatus Latescibacteria bacterium]|nr:glycosyl hydrolase family 2 [Candidatus Latescibacterota bacterium]
MNHRFLCIVICVIFTSFNSPPIFCQELSHSFEFRYVSDKSEANGETDFKGETEVFDTEERINFLRNYAEYAKDFFHDPELNTEVVTDKEVEDLLSDLKKQPLPSTRRRIPLDEWKWIGSRPGIQDEERNNIAWWNNLSGITVKEDMLVLTGSNVKVTKTFDPLTWRFKFEWRAMVPQRDKRLTFTFSNNGQQTLVTGFRENGQMFYTDWGEEKDYKAYESDRWYSFVLEGDLTENRYNLYVDGSLAADFVLFNEQNTASITSFTIEGSKGAQFDDFLGISFVPTGDVRVPYSMVISIDEDFTVRPEIEGWNSPDYDDSAWGMAKLPKVHGGKRYAGEDLYLRTRIHADKYERAVLNVETLDPGGEIWVNGEIAAVIDNRHPACVDISEYLKPDADNLLAVRVKHIYSEDPMGHAPDDKNIGWFAGRMSVDLTPKVFIDDVYNYTRYVSDPVSVSTNIVLKNGTPQPYSGFITVNWYQWYPQESRTPAASLYVPVWVRAWGDKTLNEIIDITGAKIWTFDNPNLYKVEVILEDESEKPVDDYVVTTGIRTVRQDGGVFRINGKPEMLNGAQTMGFRVPIENNATWNRCAPEEWNARELLMIKKMNGNLLRVHVHAWQGPSGNINDPRIPEIADQLGVMLIWGTTAWIRSLEGFAVDFEGYPKYMRQVYNHPSIVMWEASNHPNQFKNYDVSESNAFVEKVYGTIYPVDQSRLISVSSFIGHLHYGNDAGTVDYQGNKMLPTLAWTAPKVTRGNQDSITGYGKLWSVLRTWPSAYYKDFLESRERAYFNFEHEESIGQPNWSLVKGKPWYKLQSYEWEYDEGSIGRKLTADEWQESQAWQAFSAYEAMKKQRILDYDGFSWCCLHGGANSGTYKKPLIDCYSHAKLAFYVNAMVFQRVLAGSSDVDVVYGSEDKITPVILNLGDSRTVNLTVIIKNMDKKEISRQTYADVKLTEGRTITMMPEFKPNFPAQGYYAVEYIVE